HTRRPAATHWAYERSRRGVRARSRARADQRRAGVPRARWPRISRAGALVVGEDADQRAVHDEPACLERIAQRSVGSDAPRLCSYQGFGTREARLAESARKRHRLIPLHEVDVPHRAVIELTAVIGYIFENVERRFLVEDGCIQTLALHVVLACLA